MEVTMRINNLLLLACLACVNFSGCQGVTNTMRPSGKNSFWNPLSTMTKPERAAQEQKNKKQNPPASMAVIWKDSVLEKPGVPSIKGFGGRIFFYDKDNQSVTADGELVIYGYDDSQDRRPENVADSDEVSNKRTKADRKFVFTADQFQTHYSETELGASYSVWIPWEKVGGYRKTIVLIPIFKSADGNVLKSAQSINVLPGKSPGDNVDAANYTISRKSTTTASKSASGSVQQAAFESGSDSTDPTAIRVDGEEPVYNQPRIRTSTISLTPGMAARLAMPMPAPVQQATAAPSQLVLPTVNAIPNKATSKSSVSNQLDRSTSSDSTSEQSPQSTFARPSTAPIRQPSTVFGSPGSFR